MNESNRLHEDRGDWEEFCQARARFFEHLERQSVLARMERALGGRPLLPAPPPDRVRSSPVLGPPMGDET